MRTLDFEACERLSASSALVPVYLELPGDLPTPVSFLGRDPVAVLEKVREALR